MELEKLLAGLAPSPRRPVVVTTGAGMSVASKIPTFRGPEGYWTVGSDVYHPQDMATMAAFRRMPREVWRWYLYRKGVCNRAEPNEGHRLLAALEAALGDGLAVVTQNVDGLHVRGGNTAERTYEVHGSIDRMRDLDTGEVLPIPDDLALHDKDAPLTDDAWERLAHPETGSRMRPHVLWFDERYDEKHYRIDSALGLAASACAVVVVGTSGAASAPYLVVERAMQSGAAVVDINPDDNPFREYATHWEKGCVLDMGAVEGLKRVVEGLRSASPKE